MVQVLSTLTISAGRTVTIVRMRRADKPEKLRLVCSTYTETDATGQAIPLGKDAVLKILGGKLFWQDYDSIAAVLLDGQVVGETVADRARAYQAQVSSSDSLTLSDPWMDALDLFEFDPMQEVALLSLRLNTFTGRLLEPPQPFVS